MVRRPRRYWLLTLMIALGCGGSDASGPEVTLSPGFLVGNWRATSLVLTNQADQTDTGDIVALFDASFTLDVQESGRYLAILSAFGQASSESGTLSVSGSVLTMRRELPSPLTSVSTILRDGTDVLLDGETLFDFNQDGELEDADLHIALTPR